jgi:DNA-binding MarR family transcriptional regulator
MPGTKKKRVRGHPALVERIRRVADELAAREEAALRPLGLGRSQVLQLEEVVAAPGLSASELARRVDLAPQSVAVSVLLLESRGWLLREPHPVHRRLVELTVTPAGRRVLVRARRVLARVEAGAVAGLSAPGRKSLGKLLAGWDAALRS